MICLSHIALLRRKEKNSLTHIISYESFLAKAIILSIYTILLLPFE